MFSDCSLLVIKNESNSDLNEITFAYINSLVMGQHYGINLVNIGQGNGLVPVQQQAIAQTTADIVSVEPLGTSLNETKLLPPKGS